MTTAPAFCCAVCGRRIGSTRTHVLLDYPAAVTADRLLCVSCMTNSGRKRLHRRFYPDCPYAWHDLYDHRSCAADRDCAAHVLGLAHTPKETTA